MARPTQSAKPARAGPPDGRMTAASAMAADRRHGPQYTWVIHLADIEHELADCMAPLRHRFQEAHLPIVDAVTQGLGCHEAADAVLGPDGAGAGEVRECPPDGQTADPVRSRPGQSLTAARPPATAAPSSIWRAISARSCCQTAIPPARSMGRDAPKTRG